MPRSWNLDAAIPVSRVSSSLVFRGPSCPRDTFIDPHYPITSLQAITPSLHTLGYSNLTSIDFSSTLIAQMSQRHAHVNFQCRDIRELLLPSSLEKIGPLESYDLIIDKGTLDALVAEKGSVWDPSDKVRENAKKEIDAVVACVPDLEAA